MRIDPLPPYPLDKSSQPGTFAVLPAMWDLGGGAGTAAGAIWLGEQLSSPEIQPLLKTPYAVAQPLRFDHIFARLEPGLLMAAQTLRSWQYGYRPLWLCGDHGLAIGPVRAASLYDRPLTVIIFDAHPDRYFASPSDCGGCQPLPNEVTQGNISTFIGREKSVRSLVQVGIRERLNLADNGDPANLHVLSAEQILADPIAAQSWLQQQLDEALMDNGLIMLSIDLDVLDSKEFSAVDSPEAGGLNHELFRTLVLPVAQHACSIDISEFNPLRDPSHQSSHLAFKLVCEIIAEAAPNIGRRAWQAPQLEVPSGMLFPLSPTVATIINGEGICFELTPIESCLLNDNDLDEMRSQFHDGAINQAAMNLREVMHLSTKARPTHFAPPSSPKRLTPSDWLEGGIRHVEGLTTTPDGGYLAAGDWDHNIYCWPLPIGSGPPTQLQGHSAWVIGVDFSPDGNWLASASDDGHIGLWSMGREGPPQLNWAHDHWAKTVAWHPAGDHVASASFDGTLRLWALGNPDLVRHIDAHPGAIWSLSWSADGKEIVSSGTGGLLRRWDPNNGTLIQELQGHEFSVERCQHDKLGRIWALGLTGYLTCHGDAEKPDAVIQASASGYDLALLEAMGLILVADLHSIRCIRMNDLTIAAELAVDFAVSSVLPIDHHQVAVAGDSTRIAIFDLEQL